ncbi:MAG: MFS transporter [Bacillota bacterium]|nr:MFS transporter [Bacillota bacterium]
MPASTTSSPPVSSDALARATANRARNLLVGAHALEHVLSSSLPVLLIFIRQELDLSFTDMGIIIAAGSLTGGLVQFPAGLLVDFLGARSLMLVGFGLALGGSFLFSTAATLPVMLLARVVIGIGNATFHPASFPEMAKAARHSGVGMGMALHNVGGSLGMSLGYGLTALLAGWFGWRGSLRVLCVAGALLIAAFAFVYPRLPADEDDELAKKPAAATASSRPARELLGKQWLPVVSLAAAAALSGAFGNALQSFLPAFLTTTRGVSVAVAGAFSTITLLAGTVGSIGGGRAGDRYDRSLVVLIATAVTAALVLALAWTPLGAAGLVVLLVLVGVFRSIPRPCLNAITSEIAPRGKSGSTFGLVFGAMSLGGSLASPAVGYIADRWSMPMAFSLVASLFLVHGLVIRRLYAGKPSRSVGAPGTAVTPSQTAGPA